MTNRDKADRAIAIYGGEVMALAMLHALKEDRWVILSRDVRWAQAKINELTTGDSIS